MSFSHNKNILNSWYSVCQFAQTIWSIELPIIVNLGQNTFANAVDAYFSEKKNILECEAQN